MWASLTNAHDKSLFSPIGDGKSFTFLDGLRAGLRTEQERSDKAATRIVDVLAEVVSLNNPSPPNHPPPPRQDMVHLHCRSRGIPPNKAAEYAVTFECPYRGCMSGNFFNSPGVQ